MTRLIAIAVLLSGAVLADDEVTTRPADFDHPEPDRRMSTLIEFPEVKSDLSVVMNCFTVVEANGKMENTACYLQNNHDEPFAMAINKAARKARMRPAIIDGRERNVYLQFRVEFVAKGEARTIRYYLNPGYEENVTAYGFRHVAGQRAIGRNEPWRDVCPKRADYAVWVRAYLGEDGHADSPTVEHARGIMPTDACIAAIEQTIVQSRYTPAYADGEPVPSTFVEPFSN